MDKIPSGGTPYTLPSGDGVDSAGKKGDVVAPAGPNPLGVRGQVETPGVPSLREKILARRSAPAGPTLTLTQRRAEMLNMSALETRSKHGPVPVGDSPASVGGDSKAADAKAKLNHLTQELVADDKKDSPAYPAEADPYWQEKSKQLQARLQGGPQWKSTAAPPTEEQRAQRRKNLGFD